MKKLFLSLAVASCVCVPVFSTLLSKTSATPIDENVALFQEYKGMEEFPYYQMGYAPEVKDGNLVVTNDEAKGNWEVQYFVCYDFDVIADAEYTVTAKIKSDVEGAITVVMGNWSDERPTGNLHVEANNEWTEYSVKVGKVPTGENNQSFLIFQSGSMVGTYEVEWVKVTYTQGKEPENPTEPTGEVVATVDFSKDPYAYVGDLICWDQSIVGSAEMVDGILVLTSDGWYQTPLIENVVLKPATTYTLTVGIKADPAHDNNIAVGNWAGYGWVDKGITLTANNEWSKSSVAFTTKAVPTQDEIDSEVNENGEPIWTEGAIAAVTNPVLNFNLQPGGYTGKMDIAWVVISVGDCEPLETPALPTLTGVESIAPVVNGNANVYNLMGVKVADSLDGVAPGLYIVNGKKVIVRK